MTSLTANMDAIRQICDHLTDSAVWVTPVWGKNEQGQESIVDFEFQYGNAVSQRVTGMLPQQLVGRRVLSDRLPDPHAVQLIFDQCLQVYESGKPMEFTYLSTGLDKYLTLNRIKVQDGVLTLARNRTEEYQTNLEKERQSKLLQSLVDNSPYGICLYESVRDADGDIIDFRLKVCNKKSAEITGLTLEQLYGNTVKELMALRGQSAYWEACKGVVETGDSKYMEYYSQARNQWLAFSIVKFEDGYLLNYIDITDNKRLELQTTEKVAELDAIFNGSLSGVYSARVLKDEAGKVADLVFLQANSAFFRIFKMAPEQIIGKSLLSISNDSQQAFLQYAEEVLQTGDPNIYTLQYYNPERWFEFSIVKLQEETLLVTVNDVTAQKQAALKIEEQKALLDSILKHSPNGLAITQAIRNEAGGMVDASTVLLNDAAENYNGIPKEVMLSNTFATLNPELLESDLFKAAASLQTGESFRTEYQLPQTAKWIELAIAKMEGDRFINVFTDISPIKEAQHHLERLVEELKRSNANLEDFAYAASHDLKEPIRKIRVFAEQLKVQYHDKLDAAGRNTFERLELAAQRMNLLIEDLLEYAHVNQGIENVEEVNLNLKAQKAIEDLELSIEEKGATIHLEKLPVVQGNKRQLQQLFQNLIGNAIKYNRPDAPPEVRITAKEVKGRDAGLELSPLLQEQSFHLIQIKDNGIGFSQKDADRIFNVFTRLHANPEYKGTGVGLSIVRKVVENHKGFIRAESSPGAGALFSVYLPA